MNYFNLKRYEESDLKALIHYNKHFNGFTRVKLNKVDKIISKEHKYGYCRMCPFGMWMLVGLFIPSWIILTILLEYFFNNINSSVFNSFIINVIIGVILQIIYSKSCDKIDYNYLINKIQQINIFEILNHN